MYGQIPSLCAHFWHRGHKLVVSVGWLAGDPASRTRLSLTFKCWDYSRAQPHLAVACLFWFFVFPCRVSLYWFGTCWIDEEGLILAWSSRLCLPCAGVTGMSHVLDCQVLKVLVGSRTWAVNIKGDPPMTHSVRKKIRVLYICVYIQHVHMLTRMYMYVINPCSHRTIRKCRSFLTHHCELLEHKEGCVCIHTCMYIYIHTYVYTHVHIYIHTYACICMLLTPAVTVLLESAIFPNTSLWTVTTRRRLSDSRKASCRTCRIGRGEADLGAREAGASQVYIGSPRPNRATEGELTSHKQSILDIH